MDLQFSHNHFSHTSAELEVSHHACEGWRGCFRYEGADQFCKKLVQDVAQGLRKQSFFHHGELNGVCDFKKVVLDPVHFYLCQSLCVRTAARHERDADGACRKISCMYAEALRCRASEIPRHQPSFRNSSEAFALEVARRNWESA